MAAENSTAPPCPQIAKLGTTAFHAMTTDTHPKLASHCPLCGGDNRCAMELERAAGESQAPCWCVQETFPPDLIAALPGEAQGKACICINCLRAFARRSTP